MQSSARWTSDSKAGWRSLPAARRESASGSRPGSPPRGAGGDRRADPDRVREAADRIGGRGVVFDSADLDAVPGVIADVESALGPIDVYVANTGGPPAGPDPPVLARPVGGGAPHAVLSPMAFLERLLPGMRERGWGASSGLLERDPRADREQPALDAHRPGPPAALKILPAVAADGVTINTVFPDGSRPTARSRPRLARGRRGGRARNDPRPPARDGRGDGRARRLPLLGPGELRHRHDLLVDGGLTATI